MPDDIRQTILDPNSIVVKNRQRKIVEIDDHFIASIRQQLLHPIVLRHTNDGPTLVVGGRRLEALKSIGTPLVENIHFRFIETLDESSAKIAELEENIKRSDLTWREHIEAIGEIHNQFSSSEPSWSSEKTAERINISLRHLQRMLLIHKNISSPLLRDATSYDQAYNILQIAAERRTAQIISDITNTGSELFVRKENPETNLESGPSEDGPGPNRSKNLSNGAENLHNRSPIPRKNNSETPKPDPNAGGKTNQPGPPILTEDFLTWAREYSSDFKFNLIHVDFPYGITYEKFGTGGRGHAELDGTYDNDKELYSALVKCFVENLDKFCSYSAHVIFWFSMDFYASTKQKLESAGLEVQTHPLIWFKTDHKGILPGAQTNRFPRRVYETAFLCSRGKRTLVKPMDNVYGCPHVSNAIHPSHKPEPMLRHFFSMLVDETTDVFDPTAGSGSALRAAEDSGARSVLGLEINPDYAEAANRATMTARQLRKASGR